MNKFLLLIVFAVHLVITAVVCGEHGVLSVFPPFSESYTTQIFSDLVIALTLVNIWIYFDLKKMGKPIYYSLAVLIGTALSGSFAPLSYLLVRDKLKST
jgi:hypothetical protein